MSWFDLYSITVWLIITVMVIGSFWRGNMQHAIFWMLLAIFIKS